MGEYQDNLTSVIEGVLGIAPTTTVMQPWSEEGNFFIETIKKFMVCVYVKRYNNPELKRKLQNNFSNLIRTFTMKFGSKEAMNQLRKQMELKYFIVTLYAARRILTKSKVQFVPQI